MISLVLPTYNGATYLQEQLDSIYNQTLVPDEIIIVDDCSTDNTVSILEEYKKKYGLKYVVNETNLGYNKNFEKGINLAQGDFICLSDQDDIWLPNKVESLYKQILKYPNSVPACVSSGIVPVDKNQNLLRDIAVGSDYSGERVLYTYSSQGCTMMFNRKLWEVISPIPEGIMYDAYIGISSAIIGYRYHINKPLMKYRIHGDNAVGSIPKKGLNENKRFGRNAIQIFFRGEWLNIMQYTVDNYKAKIIDLNNCFVGKALSYYSAKNPVSFMLRIVNTGCMSGKEKFYTIVYLYIHIFAQLKKHKGL